ncbi:helix-turn-helix transcriptional regulator [Streptomyces cinnamoneus]|uniref:helix-turn-helix transcriptional regulator n=1 Tax=Streptomyces cinnamoneus TaxID=53446 RepID=UPI00343A2FD8
MTDSIREKSLAQLDLSDYHRVMRLVEECGSARSFVAFRETVVDALRRHLGYRHITFFAGDSLPGLFHDEDPLAVGRARRMVPAYIEESRRLDPFAISCCARPPAGPVPVALEACVGPRIADHREYLDRFLFRHGIHAKVVIPMPCATGVAGIGLLAEESGAFAPRELARIAAVAPHLSNLFALHAQAAVLRPPGYDRLTPRQAEVARMAVCGASNQQIAAALYISVDTVKKHLTAAYRALGCTRRTQLAALWNSAGRPGA